MRIERLQAQVDCVWIENPVDLYYLTGLKLSKGILGVTKKEAVLFVDGRYFARAEKEAPCTVKMYDEAMNWGVGKEIEVDSAYMTMDRFEALKKTLNVRGRSGILKKFRAIKDPSEIQKLKRAAKITYAGFEHVQSLLQEGVSEEELALAFETFVRKAGASGLSFDPIIAFGENSAYPHYRAGKARLKKDQVVLIDVGAVVDGYAGDLTRVVIFGENSELKKMLEWTIMAHQKAIDAIRIGSTFGDLDRAARSVFREKGVEELFTHSLGHGIGLETHEFPIIRVTSPDADLKIEEGMAFTIEPGLYKPGLGGVRWEDVVIVTKNGIEKC